MANKINREHKSTLFTTMFSDKKNALEMYNALNDSNYDNPEEITITTLENAIFINRYNDVSYILDWVFNLYEHQSTYNPNMPLRSLFYISDTYEKLIDNDRIYGSKLVEIPTPKIVVFYNGKAEQPDRQYLKLSDAYANKNIQGDLELNVLMLNVNHNHNKELMSRCEAFRGYAIYIAKFREYNEIESVTTSEAAQMAINYCIEHDIMADFFAERRKEVIGMILEFTEERANEFIGKLEQEIKDKNQEIESKKQEIEDKNQEIEEQRRKSELQQQEIEKLHKLLAENNIVVPE